VVGPVREVTVVGADRQRLRRRRGVVGRGAGRQAREGQHPVRNDREPKPSHGAPPRTTTPLPCSVRPGFGTGAGALMIARSARAATGRPAAGAGATRLPARRLTGARIPVACPAGVGHDPSGAPDRSPPDRSPLLSGSPPRTLRTPTHARPLQVETG